MPYAIDGKISKREIEGGIEITNDQYREALQAQLEGHEVAVRSGELRILSREKRTVYNKNDKTEKKIPENENTPDGYTDQEPGKFDEWDEDVGEWVKDEKAKAHARIREIDSELEALDRRYGDRALREDMLERDAFKSDEARQRIQGAEDRASDLRKERDDLIDKHGSP